jgi:hypothetical protein
VSVWEDVASGYSTTPAKWSNGFVSHYGSTPSSSARPLDRTESELCYNVLRPVAYQLAIPAPDDDRAFDFVSALSASIRIILSEQDPSFLFDPAFPRFISDNIHIKLPDGSPKKMLRARLRCGLRTNYAGRTKCFRIKSNLAPGFEP